MLIALVTRSIARARWLLLALLVLFSGFQLLVIISARDVYRGQLFSQLAALVPAGLRQMSGGLVFTSFAGFATFGFFHPVVILIFVEAAIFLASEPAWDVESGMVDLTVARPVPRAFVIGRTLIVACGAAAALAGAMVLSTRLALHAFAPATASWPRFDTTVRLGANLTAVAWCFASLSVLIAAAVRRRSAAVGLAGLTAVLLYLVHLLAELWRPARPFRVIAPYHYYNAPAILEMNDATWSRDIGVLLLVATALAACAFVVYQRRDL